MPSPALSSTPSTYAELRRKVEETLLKGQRAIEHTRLLTYHETGRLINAHVLLKGTRSDYGAEIVQKLAHDLNVARTTVYQCAQFARYFPIVRARGQLTWAYYRALCQVADEGQRDALLRQTVQHDWTSADLEERVRAFNATPATSLEAGPAASQAAARPLLTPNRGTPGLHLVVDRGAGPVVDLGFKLYRELGSASKLKAGDIVRWTDGGLRVVADATKAQLFTYAATLRRVVDGDTLVVALEAAPGIFVEQKLRLRGLDCPELSTPEGKAAKRFVDALVLDGRSLVLSTTKPDKYDRYLADVFLQPTTGEEIFVNNALLQNAHAVRKDAWEFRDWEKDWL